MPQGLANIAIRWRLDGPFSHSEAVFEHGDGVDQWMPDGTCAPDENGALWCCSAVAAERLPPWSRRRAGRIGGVRFKRIVLDPAKWTTRPAPVNPVLAAHRAIMLEGALYDWQQILGYLAWPIPHKASRLSCAEAVATLFGLPDAHRFDPCSLDAAVQGMAYAHALIHTWNMRNEPGRAL